MCNTCCNTKTMYILASVIVCVPYSAQNKQRLFLHRSKRLCYQCSHQYNIAGSYTGVAEDAWCKCYGMMTRVIW